MRTNGSKDSRPLSIMQKKYVAARIAGLNMTQAAQSAGYKDPACQGNQIEHKPYIKAELERQYKKHERLSDMSKKKVMDGMLEAIEQAKLMADPSAQISGWREIARMCGYYEPQRLKVEVSVSAKRMLSQYEALSDDELLKLADQTIIDSDDFEVMEESDQNG